MAQTVEDLFIQQLIAQSTVERLDEGVLGWLARLDVVPGDTLIALPTEDRATGQLRAVLRGLRGFATVPSNSLTMV